MTVILKPVLHNTIEQTSWPREHWKQELSDAVSSPGELLSLLELEQTLASSVIESSKFQLRVPRHYIKKMTAGDPHDPLLRQVLPVIDENHNSGSLDPVGDLQAMPTPGLHHKYHGRALMITTGACAIHCRYCFRRHYPYEQANIKQKHLDTTLTYLQSHTEIKEVILSGGDPLVLNDSKISRLIEALERIEHIQWLRIHTRLPVVLPSRITDSLLEIFSRSRFRITLIVHANHANELSDDEHNAFSRIKQHGVTLLNQSVLLRGVNDDAQTLIALSEKLYNFGVLPYYLHCFDPVRGAMHFDTDTDAAGLIESMRCKLPGFLVPRLVREIAGEPAKTPIFNI